MARTYRNIPTIHRSGGRSYPRFIRKPRFRWKLLAGIPVHSKHLVTDWDDKPIAALHEAKHQIS